MNIKKQFPTIQLIVYDFDGVMTDNKVYVDQTGIEMVRVSRADGFGVAEIKKLGITPTIYESGSWGPKSSAKLIDKYGFSWHEPDNLKGA